LKRVDLPTLGRPTIPMVRLTGVQVTWAGTPVRPIACVACLGPTFARVLLR
jgi:hypothetical protein